MKNIKKAIKINPNDIIYACKFVNSTFDWSKDEFLKMMEDVVKKRSDKKDPFLVRIKPNFLLIPVYSYFFTQQTVMEDFGFKVAYEDIIDAEKISQFKVRRLPNTVDAMINLVIKPSIGKFSGTKVRILGIKFNIKHKSKQDDRTIDISVYFGHKRDYELLEMELKTLKKSQGESFHKISNFIDPRVAKEIYGVEKSMFTIFNFIYTLYTGKYTGEFGKGDPQAEVLLPFVEILKGYGKTFEEVLDAIKVASLFTM